MRDKFWATTGILDVIILVCKLHFLPIVDLWSLKATNKRIRLELEPLEQSLIEFSYSQFVKNNKLEKLTQFLKHYGGMSPTARRSTSTSSEIELKRNARAIITGGAVTKIINGHLGILMLSDIDLFINFIDDNDIKYFDVGEFLTEDDLIKWKQCNSYHDGLSSKLIPSTVYGNYKRYIFHPGSKSSSTGELESFIEVSTIQGPLLDVIDSSFDISVCKVAIYFNQYDTLTLAVRRIGDYVNKLMKYETSLLTRIPSSHFTDNLRLEKVKERIKKYEMRGFKLLNEEEVKKELNRLTKKQRL
jgi:hypothetical protein